MVAASSARCAKFSLSRRPSPLSNPGVVLQPAQYHLQVVWRDLQQRYATLPARRMEQLYEVRVVFPVPCQAEVEMVHPLFLHTVQSYVADILPLVTIGDRMTIRGLAVIQERGIIQQSCRAILPCEPAEVLL